MRGLRLRSRMIFLQLALVATACGCISGGSNGLNSEGVMLYQKGRYEEAAQRFRSAIAMFPGNPDGYYNLAACYHQMGTSSGNQQYFQEAEQYYRQAIQIDDNHSYAYRGLAVLLTQLGRCQEAFALLEQWATRHPDSAEPLVELARLHQELGNSSVAKDYLVQALSIDPKNARALAALGYIREREGQLAQALQNYERSLFYAPHQPYLSAKVSNIRLALAAENVPASESPTQIANSQGITTNRETSTR